MQRIRVVGDKNKLTTECYIDDYELKNVRSVKADISVDMVPTFTFEVVGYPEIDMPGEAIIHFRPRDVVEASRILRNELLRHGDLYGAFVNSITSALKENCCGLPFEPEESIAVKILDYVIGDEKCN